MRRSVTVTKLTQRAFTAAQWADLRAQLAAWKVPRSCLCIHCIRPNTIAHLRACTQTGWEVCMFACLRPWAG